MRNELRCIVVTVCLAGAVLIGLGCSESVPRPKMGKVSGVVTYQGSPLSGASVTFVSETAGVSRFGNGTTDAAGKFQLTTFEKNDGAIVGDYVVTITKQEAGNQPMTPADAANMATLAVPKSLVPVKYTDPKTTPFKQSVVNGTNTVKLDLVDD